MIAGEIAFLDSRIGYLNNRIEELKNELKHRRVELSIIKKLRDNMDDIKIEKADYESLKDALQHAEETRFVERIIKVVKQIVRKQEGE